MTIARGFALLMLMAPSAIACRDTPEAKASQAREVQAERRQVLARRIADADANPTNTKPLAMWLVPAELKEISGLTLKPNGNVLAHNDEVARIFEIDPRSGIVLKHFSLEGAPKGDFEAIAIAGADVYLLNSNGNLMKFKEGADGEVVAYTKQRTNLGRECEFESMVYEPDSSRLLLACKKVGSKSMKDDLVIYRVPLPFADTARITVLAVPLEQVIGANPWKNFEPADMAIDPATKNYVLISSLQKGIAVITPGGDVIRSGPLPPGHPQPEGLAITTDGIMIISDEATTKPAAITLYRWR
jgi:uncharacterized protein YjiK